MAGKTHRILAVSIALLAAGVIGFLALMPYPEVGRLHLLPRTWARFIDHQHSLRHVVGFTAFHLLLALLGLSVGWLDSFRRRAWLAAVLIVLAAALELGQLARPHRSVDLKDVLASWAGIALAWLVIEGGLRWFPRLRASHSTRHAD